MSYCLLAEDMAALIEAVGLEQPLACGYATAAKSGWRWGYTTLVWRAYVVSGAIYMWPDTYLPMFKRIGLTGPDEVDYAKVATDALLLDLLHASSMWLTPWHYADDELSKIGEPT